MTQKVRELTTSLHIFEGDALLLHNGTVIEVLSITFTGKTLENRKRIGLLSPFQRPT